MDRSYSVKLAMRDEVKKDDTSSLYLQVIINRSVIKVPLKLSWPKAFFDRNKGELLKRNRTDQDHNDYQMIITREIAKANEIFKTYRLSDRELNRDLFVREFNSFTSKKDFLEFMYVTLRERHKRGKIAWNTFRAHRSTYEKVKTWRASIPFSELNAKLMSDLEAYLKKKAGNKHNTVWKAMKDLRTYMNLAREERIVFDYPFDKYHISEVKSPRTHLEIEEVKRFLDLYHTGTVSPAWKQVLKHFLFSCFTGLRFSDIMQIRPEMVHGEVLEFEPVKTTRYNKRAQIPLSETARRFITYEGRYLFETFSEQACNRALKDIAAHLEVKKHVTLHVARHSFATIFLELGGKVEVLKDILGHSDIKTTMVYVHITEARKREQMAAFDGAFKPKP